MREYSVETMMMTRQVEREKLETCMTCPLCHKLFRDATTISECLHTFCRKCIYKKINDEEFGTCPTCNINLGCAPLENLRADHSLDDLKTKFFPSKKNKTKAPAVVLSVPEDVPSLPLPAKRKEISLSSLVVSLPKVSSIPALPRKRLKAIARKNPALRESILIEESVKKVDDLHERSTSPETQTKFILNEDKPRKDSGDDRTEPCESKADTWNTLKPDMSNPQDTLVKMQLPDPAEDELDEEFKNGDYCDKLQGEDNEDVGYRWKVNGDENDSSPSPSSSVEAPKVQGVQQKTAAEPEGLTVSANADIDASGYCGRQFSPLWFSLVASNDQVEDAPLPQITSCYLRVKDGSLPVSTIKKYLVRKLGLTSEAEVEISLQGKPVVSTVLLHNIVDWWLKMTPASEIIQTTVGSSAKDFVMVLSYGRKAQSP